MLSNYLMILGFEFQVLPRAEVILTLILLTSTKWRAPASDSKWRMGFNSAFKGLMHCDFKYFFLQKCGAPTSGRM
jgi:hypothetical protein